MLELNFSNPPPIGPLGLAIGATWGTASLNFGRLRAEIGAYGVCFGCRGSSFAPLTVSVNMPELLPHFPSAVTP